MNRRVFVDDRGRERTEESIVRDYLGRNRERAMEMLGMEDRAGPGAPPFAIRPEVDERTGGVRLVQIGRAHV